MRLCPNILLGGVVRWISTVALCLVVMVNTVDAYSIKGSGLSRSDLIHVLESVTNKAVISTDNFEGTYTMDVTNEDLSTFLDEVGSSMKAKIYIQGDFVYVEDLESDQSVLPVVEEPELAMEPEKPEVQPEVKKEVFAKDILYRAPDEIEKLVKDLRDDIKISIDPTARKAFIYGTPEDDQAVSELLANVDVLPKEVLVEARIALVDSDVFNEMGIQWGLLNNSVTGSVVPQTTSELVSLDVSLGTFWGTLDSLDIKLRAAASNDQVEVVSEPSLRTISGIGAKLDSGETVPFQTVSQNGTQTTFQNAFLSLEVIPVVLNDGFIRVRVVVSKDSVGTPSPAGSRIVRRSAATELTSRDGEIIVLAALVDKREEKTNEGVPYIKDLPYLGELFKSESTNVIESNLVIFLKTSEVKRAKV